MPVFYFFVTLAWVKCYAHTRLLAFLSRSSCSYFEAVLKTKLRKWHAQRFQPPSSLFWAAANMLLQKLFFNTGLSQLKFKFELREWNSLYDGRICFDLPSAVLSHTPNFVYISRSPLKCSKRNAPLESVPFLRCGFSCFIPVLSNACIYSSSCRKLNSSNIHRKSYIYFRCHVLPIFIGFLLHLPILKLH